MLLLPCSLLPLRKERERERQVIMSTNTYVNLLNYLSLFLPCEANSIFEVPFRYLFSEIGCFSEFSTIFSFSPNIFESNFLWYALESFSAEFLVAEVDLFALIFSADRSQESGDISGECLCILLSLSYGKSFSTDLEGMLLPVRLLIFF